MSMDLSGKAAFTAFIKELGLTSLLDTFEQNGWETFRDFAFSVPHSAKDEHFEEKVVPVLLKLDTPEGRKLLPRLRQLYAQAYTVAAEAMKQFSSQEGVSQKITWCLRRELSV